jgi:hypothetical protein
VGPACYNPKDNSVKQKTKIADFTSTKIQRKVFEPTLLRDNDQPSKDNPGPGAYEYNTRVLHDKKNFNAQGQSCIFMSKVPNCQDNKIKSKDTPGPGYYEKPHNDISVIGEHKKS